MGKEEERADIQQRFVRKLHGLETVAADKVSNGLSVGMV